MDDNVLLLTACYKEGRGVVTLGTKFVRKMCCSMFCLLLSCTIGFDFESLLWNRKLVDIKVTE